MMRHGRRVTLALPLCFFQISLSRSTRAIVFFGVGRGVRPSLVGADHVSISGRAAIKSIDWASGALELGRHDSVGRRLLVGTTRLSGLLYELRSGKGFFLLSHCLHLVGSIGAASLSCAAVVYGQQRLGDTVRLSGVLCLYVSVCVCLCVCVCVCLFWRL